MVLQFFQRRQERRLDDDIQKGILFDLEAQEFLNYMKIKCDGFSQIDENARWVDVIRMEIPEMPLLKDQAKKRYFIMKLNASCDTPQHLTHSLDKTEK